MLERVLQWIEEGKDVRIFTARVAGENAIEAKFHIRKWCSHHLSYQPKITCIKDFGMIELWDDRCVQVEKNTGRRMDEG